MARRLQTENELTRQTLDETSRRGQKQSREVWITCVSQYFRINIW